MSTKKDHRDELCSPKENKKPPLVVQGEVDFAKQKTEGLRKSTIYLRNLSKKGCE